MLIPILYLKGVSTGDFEEALAALLGKHAPGLSPSTIARLKETWIEEYARWKKTRFVGQALCLCLGRRSCAGPARGRETMHSRPDRRDAGGQERSGARESAQDWRELLLDLKNRGLIIAPKLARILEGHRRGLAGEAGTALLGAQDRQRPQ